MGGKTVVGVDSVEMIEDRKRHNYVDYIYIDIYIDRDILKVYKNRTQYKTR